MSGLVGLISRTPNRVDPKLFQQIVDEVVFRPDWQLEECVSPNGLVKSALISKGILHRGSQPALSSDGRTALFIDGEVFNDDLKTDDQPKAILEAYLREGTSLFKRLNGYFILCIIKLQENKIHLISDRFGYVPLYYTESADYFAYCSELKPLLNLPNFVREIDPLGVENFISSGFFVGDTTLFSHVKTMKVGEWLTISPNQFEKKNYWTFYFTDQRDPRNQAEIETELVHLTNQAVKRQLSDDRVIAFTTSGGYDSRCLLYHYRHQNPDRIIHTVTWGETEDNPSCDAAIARRLSTVLNTQHTFYKLQAEALPQYFHDYVRYSEGRTDAVGNYPEGLKVFEKIREQLGIEVLVRGNEPFGVRREVFRKKDALHVAFMDDFSCYPKSFGYIKHQIYNALLEIAKIQVGQLHESCPYDHPVDRKDWLFFKMRPPSYWGPLSQLKKHCTEERNPLLDNDVVELVRHLHPHQRVWKNLFTTSVVNKIPGANQVPFATVVSLIDWDKRITTNLELQKFIRKILLEKNNGFDEIIDQNRLKSFLQHAFTHDPDRRHTIYNRIRRKIRNRMDVWDLETSLEIFRLMILKVWVDIYCDGEFKINLT